MSQMTGGKADKIGNAFERLWIVNLTLCARLRFLPYQLHR
jgi:hypothetical protein